MLHLVLAIRLKLRSVAARPVAYQFPGNVQATIASRTMIWTGIVVGLFTLFHLAHFTFGWVHGAEVAPGKVVNYLELKDDKGRHDVYRWWSPGSHPMLVVLYVLAQVALFVHLLHGIQSSFQTLGLKNRRFAGPIRLLGLPSPDDPGRQPRDCPWRVGGFRAADSYEAMRQTSNRRYTRMAQISRHQAKRRTVAGGSADCQLCIRVGCGSQPDLR